MKFDLYRSTSGAAKQAAPLSLKFRRHIQGFLFGIEIKSYDGVSWPAFYANPVFISFIQADLIMDIAYSESGGFLE